LFFRWQIYFHGKNMQELKLSEFKEEVKSVEFAWSSFNNKSAEVKPPENFFSGEVSHSLSFLYYLPFL
jgi:hypothetical protein